MRLSAPSTTAAPVELEAGGREGPWPRSRAPTGPPARRALRWRSRGPGDRLLGRGAVEALVVGWQGRLPASTSSQVGVEPMSTIAIIITALAKRSANASRTPSARQPPPARSSPAPVGGGRRRRRRPTARSGAVGVPLASISAVLLASGRSGQRPSRGRDPRRSSSAGIRYRPPRPRRLRSRPRPPRRCAPPAPGCQGREGRRRRVSVGVVGADRDHRRAPARLAPASPPRPGSSLPWWATLSTSTGPGSTGAGSASASPVEQHPEPAPARQDDQREQVRVDGPGRGRARRAAAARARRGAGARSAARPGEPPGRDAGGPRRAPRRGAAREQQSADGDRLEHRRRAAGMVGCRGG